MIIVREHLITASVYDILQTLRTQLIGSDIYLLRDMKPIGDNVQVTCPFHKDGQERKPSCGVASKSKGKIEAGQFHCFTCGESGDMGKLISYCFGHDDNGKFGREWLLKNFLSVGFENRKSLDLASTQPRTKADLIYVEEADLEQYRYTHDYILGRGISEEVLDLFDVGWDAKENSITLPARDPKGRTLFITRRNIRTKFYARPEGVKKPVYGLYELGLIDYFDGTVIVCESEINALTCHTHGRAAVALLGTGTKEQYEQLSKDPRIRKIILAFDGDEAGDKGVINFAKNVRNKLLRRYHLPQGKDINDLREKFLELEECLV